MANEKIVIITKANFEEKVLKAGTAVMVDFWAPWCGPCRMVSPIMDELAVEFDGKATVAKVNVDEEGELAEKFRVMSIPTVMVFKNGQVVEKIVGSRSKDEFAKVLEKNL